MAPVADKPAQLSPPKGGEEELKEPQVHPTPPPSLNPVPAPKTIHIPSLFSPRF
jgi:hypothetical protein